jgi:hypothetical protein
VQGVRLFSELQAQARSAAAAPGEHLCLHNTLPARNPKPPTAGRVVERHLLRRRHQPLVRRAVAPAQRRL